MKAHGIRFCPEEDLPQWMHDEMPTSTVDHPLVPNFQLGNPKLRPWSAEEEVDLYEAKGWAYGADGSRIEDGDEVLVIGSRSWSFFACKVDYFHGCNRTSCGLRVIAQTSPDEFEVFAYEMVSLSGHAIRVLAFWQRRWREYCDRAGGRTGAWMHRKGAWVQSRNGVWVHRDGRVVRAVEEEDGRAVMALACSQGGWHGAGDWRAWGWRAWDWRTWDWRAWD